MQNAGEHEVERDAGEAPGRGQPDAHALRVVLVEDHANYTEQLRDLIHALSRVAVVHIADKENDAVRWLGENTDAWDVLVLDIFLSDGHGFKVLRTCGSLLPHQRAVFLTSYTREPARAQALAMGADAFFNKTETGEFLRFLVERRDCLERLPSREHH